MEIFRGMKIHEKYIKRCIEIAKNGLGTTAPNPMVGCVIVHNNKIIAEGFTSIYGGSHAEVNAIKAVKDSSLLSNATLYVTLEPCSHFGKTPPCSDLIIKHNIKHVVIGCLDSNPLVAGRGIAKLKAAGCEVITGVLEKDCREHHKRFFTFHEKKRPYIILKWAETADGFIAPKQKSEMKPVWITNAYSRQLVHKWRAEEQAILVGSKTVQEDNPSLTVRDWYGNNPVRIVLNPKGDLLPSFQVFNSEAKTIVIGSQKNEALRPSENLILEVINWESQHNLAKQICNVLWKHQINSVIIEGGAQTLQTFINENLWDEARIFISEVEFNSGVKAPILKASESKTTQNISNDTLRIYKND